MFTKISFSVLPKALFFFLLLSISFNLKAEVKVIDAENGNPLSNASVFDKNGVFIAVSNDDGTIPENISTHSYPLEIRYVGYVPVSVTSPGMGIVTMEESSYTLPEVIIDDVSKNILYLRAYVREYTTIENAKDTLASFKEQIVDYAIPVGKAGFKGWKKPRVLSQREYEYLKIEKKKTSIDTLMLTDGGKLRSTNFNIAQKFIVPECILNGDSTEYIKYGKYYPEERWTVSGAHYIYETDGMADYKDHCFQPGIMKIFGLTTAMTMDDHKYIFEKGYKSGANVENLVEATENFDLVMKGKVIKKGTEQNEDTKMAVFTEMFVIERAYLSEKEAREFKENAPGVDIATFKVPDGIPMPPAEVIKLKEAVLKVNK